MGDYLSLYVFPFSIIHNLCDEFKTCFSPCLRLKEFREEIKKIGIKVKFFANSNPSEKDDHKILREICAIT